MIFLRALWAKVWPYIAVAGAVLAGLFAVRQSGKHSEREQQQLRDAQGARQAQENRRNVEKMDDDDLAAEFDRLRRGRRR